MKPTVKLTLEGPPDLVEAVAARINQFFTVTYTSKARPKYHSRGVSRYLRCLPPAQAHTLPLGPGPGQETTEPEGENPT